MFSGGDVNAISAADNEDTKADMKPNRWVSDDFQIHLLKNIFWLWELQRTFYNFFKATVRLERIQDRFPESNWKPSTPRPVLPSHSTTSCVRQTRWRMEKTAIKNQNINHRWRFLSLRIRSSNNGRTSQVWRLVNSISANTRSEIPPYHQDSISDAKTTKNGAIRVRIELSGRVQEELLKEKNESIDSTEFARKD